MNTSTKNLSFFAMGLATMVLYYILRNILGEDSYVTIHDVLDCEFIDRLLMGLKDGSSEYNNGIVWQVLNGHPRAMLQSGINVESFIFRLLPPFDAYLLNDFLCRTIGFIGMFFLLRHLLVPNKTFSFFIILLISLMFASLASVTIHGGLTVLGQPFVLLSFIYLKEKRNLLFSFLIVVIYPFWSSFALSGIFIISALSLWFVLDFKRNQYKINYCFLVGVFTLILLYLFVEYNLLLNYFSGTTELISHRTMFNHTIELRGVLGALKSTCKLLLQTQYHAGSMSSIAIILGVVISFILNKKLDKKIIMVSFAILLIVLIFFIARIVPYFLSEPSIIKSFQWDRFYFLLPLLWLILLAFIIESIMSERKKIRYIISLLIIGFTFSSILIPNKEIISMGKGVLGLEQEDPTYRQFFAEDLFKKISEDIAKDKSTYRVVSLGIHPSVSIYNGFFTSDGYFNNYKLEHKLRFRKIMADELEKDPQLKSYFDNWGNRCYLFSSELGSSYLYEKNSNKVIKNLSFDANAAKEMDVAYVISAVEIENAESIGLGIVNEYSSETSFWKIHLYKIL